VHLRYGPVARGGLRWSDRAQDYRTEVLGLVKAQQVKNAVIVPVGAKGGFYPKQLAPAVAIRRLRGRSQGLCQLHLQPAVDHRQSRRRQGGSAPAYAGATATIPISWSPPTRARRPSPTPQTRSARRTASGLTTPSPPAARPATTTRRWASPRAAPGRPSSGTSARWTATSRRTLHGGGRRRHVGRRVRQRHAAVALHPPGRRLRPSRHLHRPRSRAGDLLRRAPAAVREGPVELAGL
jgi:hypothetical protein